MQYLLLPQQVLETLGYTVLIGLEGFCVYVPVLDYIYICLCMCVLDGLLYKSEYQYVSIT